MDAKGKGRHRKLNGKNISIEKEILMECATESDCFEELQSLMTDRQILFGHIICVIRLLLTCYNLARYLSHCQTKSEPKWLGIARVLILQAIRPCMEISMRLPFYLIFTLYIELLQY